ncbi:RodZ domain-containing protein [Comamonas antarctica]|uniref:helix-turn-helix domain-containing protein n=1 Tax=Comamonas antarctica TaxID=2743470 RepID=UPI0028EA9C4D|nr:RodZ domain-containing protein [Comamonas antarctica]
MSGEQGDTQASAGQQLRQAREAAGLHVAALAGALKVPVHKLEALEADDYAAFNDHVFMRALASSICRTLGLEVQPVLDKLPRSAIKGFDAQRMHLNAPIKARAGKSGGMAASSGGVSRKAVGAVVLLLLGAAAVYFMPDGMLDRGDAEQGREVTSQPVDAVPAPAAALPAAPAADVPAAAALPAAAPTGAVPAAIDTPPAAAPAAAAPAAAAAAATDAVPPALPGQAPLAFSATAPSWVQVKDARGAVLLSKNLGAGETAQVSATLPVQVVVGRVAATTLQVRGQPFDLAAVAQGKDVARFEVK